MPYILFSDVFPQHEGLNAASNTSSHFQEYNVCGQIQEHFFFVLFPLQLSKLNKLRLKMHTLSFELTTCFNYLFMFYCRVFLNVNELP